MSSNYFNLPEFEAINTKTKPLSQILKNSNHYHAHTSKNQEVLPETLQEHVERVNNEALRLVAEHSLDKTIDNLISDLVKSWQIEDEKDIAVFIKQLFWQTIVFHDYGKINENFQTERMKNTYFKKNSASPIQSRHSILSGYLYITNSLEQFFLMSEVTDAKTKNFVVVIILLFSNPILKHHASYLEYNLESFKENIITYSQKYLEILQIQPPSGFENLLHEDRIQYLVDRYIEHNKSDPFPLYSLLKLNFSLLTTADFCATCQYTSSLKIEDAGILSSQKIEHWYQNFWQLKSYNKNTYENQHQILSNSFAMLQQQSIQNLNMLRQKLLLQTRKNLLDNQDKHIFYLEAPTGSGKTNTSLILALEILKQQGKNKIFYVFPFTTLITQTFSSICETLGVTSDDIAQLHSKAPFPQKEELVDGVYGEEHLTYLDILFAHYPLTLMTHVRFFNVVKGNSKESNYLYHRLSNAVVIIDELQSYNPLHWDKTCMFLEKMAKYFGTRFILMSATLPKIDNLTRDKSNNFFPLLPQKQSYFQNPNFQKRVQFDISLLDKKISLGELGQFIYEKCEEYAATKNDNIKVLVEFITKKTVTDFLKENKELFSEYTVLVISGTILEPRRREVIAKVKKHTNGRLLVICTQVIEAGVDIDMDIGFKNISLIDCEEQFAGRINREATKTDSTVYLFLYDKPHIVYSKDLRYEAMKTVEIKQNYVDILETKNFDKLYQLVMDSIHKKNKDLYFKNLPAYLEQMRDLRFQKVDKDFTIIENNTQTVFVPLDIPAYHFVNEKAFLQSYDKYNEKFISGAEIWDLYKSIICEKIPDFFTKKINYKKITSVLSQFVFTVYNEQSKSLREYTDHKEDKWGMLYLSNYKQIYSYEDGITEDKDGMFL